YVFRIVKDAAVLATPLKTGEADYASITPSLVDDLRAQASLQVASYDTFSFDVLFFQLNPAKSPLFQDKRVRQALAYSLDRPSMVKAIYFDLAQVAVGTMPTVSFYAAPDKITNRYTYDIGRAN